MVLGSFSGHGAVSGYMCLMCMGLSSRDDSHGRWTPYVPAGVPTLFPTVFLLYLSHQIKHKFL